MLGESPAEIERRERCRERDRLRRLCQPASLIRWNNDTSWNLLDRLLDGPEPKVNRWGNPWRALERLAWWTWKAWTALQRAQTRLDAEGAA